MTKRIRYIKYPDFDHLYPRPPWEPTTPQPVTPDTPGHTVTQPIPTLSRRTLLCSPKSTTVDQQVSILMSHGWQLKSLCSHCIDLARGKNEKGEDFYKDLLYTAFCILTDIADSFNWSLLDILELGNDPRKET